MEDNNRRTEIPVFAAPNLAHFMGIARVAQVALDIALSDLSRINGNTPGDWLDSIERRVVAEAGKQRLDNVPERLNSEAMSLGAQVIEHQLDAVRAKLRAGKPII